MRIFSESDSQVQDLKGRAPVRLGIFGGSFDPVHRGHLLVAEAAAAAFRLDRVVFVPAAAPPHKPDRVLAEGHHRLAMLRLAIGDRPGFEVSDLELCRTGPSYTYDTLVELPRRLGLLQPELFLILGSDNLPDLPRWYRGEEILALAQPIVLLREGDEPEGLLADLRSTVDADALARLERGLLRLAPVPGRATDVRRRLARGIDPGPDVPARVAEYIHAHDLYRGRSTP